MRHKTKKEDKQYKKHNTENYKETSPKKTQNIGNYCTMKHASAELWNLQSFEMCLLMYIQTNAIVILI
jgi:hypothetical protein